MPAMPIAESSAADGGRDQADEQRHEHGDRSTCSTPRVVRERQQRTGEQEDDRQAGEQDLERDLVRRLLPRAPSTRRDHAVEEGLARVLR